MYCLYIILNSGRYPHCVVTQYSSIFTYAVVFFNLSGEISINVCGGPI